jgi:TolB-like protein
MGTIAPGLTRRAVLPFANISPDPHDEYIADGRTEELIAVLSQLGELRVIARTSVSQYKSSTKTVAQIGRELWVSAVLEGSVRRAGDHLRITVQLIAVDSEEHLWANSFDRKLENVFAVQTEIAELVANHLSVKVKPAEKTRLAEKPPVTADSYLAYLKGRTLLHDILAAALDGARIQFELAISLDPMNAAAHSGLADAIRLNGWFHSGIPWSEWFEMCQRSVARALALDPNLPQAHASLALAFWDKFDYVGAEKELKIALSLSPSDSLAHHWYGNILEDEARAEEALLHYTLAEAADPLWLFNGDRLIGVLLRLRRLDEAFARILKLEGVESAAELYHALLGRYYLAQSDTGRALQQLELLEKMKLDPRAVSLYRAVFYAIAGEKEQCRALLQSEESLPVLPLTCWSLSWRYALIGDLDRCFQFMEMALTNHALPLQKFQNDPLLAHVRADPRYREILVKSNLA